MELSNRVMLLTDAINHRDTHEFKKGTNCGPRGHVLAGYEPYIDNHGITQLGEVLFEDDNHVLVGGSNYIIDKIFDISGGLQIDTLNSILGIGLSGDAITDKNARDNIVCLFNVGVEGCGVAYTDVKDVKQQDRIVDGIVPFRVVDAPLEGSDADKYWFRKTLEDGKIAYYLKTFESTPQRKNLWKDAGDDEDGSTVAANPHTSSKNVPIETFAECILKITSKDLREYFLLYEGLEHARFNSLGLCTGIKSTLSDGTMEYKCVTQFSKLNFGNELLHMDKDLTIIYRLYNS